MMCVKNHFCKNGTFYNGSRTWSSAPEHQYVAVLRVDNLKKSDQGDEHILRVTNPRGTTEYRVKIQHITSQSSQCSQFYDYHLLFCRGPQWR